MVLTVFANAGFLMDFIRRTVVHVLILLLLLFGLNLVSSGYPIRADRAACEQIKTICQKAGFGPGGGARDGLLLACFNPIVQGTAQPLSAAKRLPHISPELVSACRTGKGSAPVAPSANLPASATLLP